MAAEILGAISGTHRIGRYFTVVSALPSAVFVSYVYLLLASGAWSGPVRFGDAVRDLDLKAGVLLAILSFTAAVALHSLQYTLIQLLEGYWGRSRVGQILAVLRINHHRSLSKEMVDEILEADEVVGGGSREPDMRNRVLLARVRRREANRLLASYPLNENDFLPTRLGNVLRRYEMSSGSPYGIGMIPAIPRMAMVADERGVQYVSDQRTQLELAVRIAVLGMLAAMITVAVMWRHGVWLLLALIPYAVAYFAYKGAIVVAHEYGTALTVMIELNRFSLYERLHLKLPESITSERELNAGLMSLLRSTLPTDRDIDYEHPPPPLQFPFPSQAGAAGDEQERSGTG
ncbi:hypothetical protein ACQPYE_27010 [Actinosynnema sp. CA-299493]